MKEWRTWPNYSRMSQSTLFFSPTDLSRVGHFPLGEERLPSFLFSHPGSLVQCSFYHLAFLPPIFIEMCPQKRQLLLTYVLVWLQVTDSAASGALTSFLIRSKRLSQGLDVRRQDWVEKLRVTSNQQSARNRGIFLAPLKFLSSLSTLRNFLLTLNFCICKIHWLYQLQVVLENKMAKSKHLYRKHWV